MRSKGARFVLYASNSFTIQRLAQVVYLLSMSLFIIGSAVVSVSKCIGLVIAMRVVQAAGQVCVFMGTLSP